MTGSGTMSRGWLERWLEREIVVEIPEGLRSANQAEFKTARIPDKRAEKAHRVEPEKPSESLAARFRDLRRGMGVTQLAAAKQMGIHFTTLNKIEAGKQQPTPAHAKAMEAWMRDMKNRPDLRAELIGGQAAM